MMGLYLAVFGCIWLYLAVFESDGEVAGVEVGSYADFGEFRSAIAKYIEGDLVGSVCPTLMLHSDCDGEWTSADSALLRQELLFVRNIFIHLAPRSLAVAWMTELSGFLGLQIHNLNDCFFDVDGEPLIDRLIYICDVSVEKGLPIFFQ